MRQVVEEEEVKAEVMLPSNDESDMIDDEKILREVNEGDNEGAVVQRGSLMNERYQYGGGDHRRISYYN